MNNTDICLSHKKETALRLLPALFLRNFAAAAAGFVGMYVLYSVFQPPVRICMPEASAQAGVDFGFLSALLRAQSGTLAALIILGVSVYTQFCPGISLLLCMWRGASLGCAVSSVRTGLFAVPPAHICSILSVSMTGAILYILLAAYSVLYADCMLYAGAVRNRDAFFSLAREYVLCFLTLSGSVLSAGVLTFLIQ